MSGGKFKEFDISVSAAKRRAQKNRGMTGAVGAGERICEWEGCEKKAAYRAPRSRDQLNEFRWFCLDHVREYNSRWNFYENMTEEEINASIQSDQLWGRRTWKFGRGPNAASEGAADGTTNHNPHSDGEAWRRFGFDDPIEVLGEKGTLNGEGAQTAAVRERLLPTATRKALGIMQLDAQTTQKEIRLRYKELVKRFHPDQNGGDRSEEARLRDVLWAWDQLKNNPAFKA